MGALGSLLGLVLLLFLLVLIARAVLDWTGVLTSSSGDGVRKARELTHRVTEPVLAPVRRVLKPVRVGDVQIDLAFTAVFIVTLILRSIVTSL